MAEETNITANATQFDYFVREAAWAMAIKQKRDWDFLGACAFTFAALLTVGYGDITPETPIGRGLTIIYCLVGLPLSVMALKTGGEAVVHLISLTEAFFYSRTCGTPPSPHSLRRCLATSVILVAVYLCLMAGLGMYLEEWSFLDSFYAWFITFSTIGFGDLVPLESFRQRATSDADILFAGIAITLPYLIGFCLVSCVINLLVEVSEKGLCGAIFSKRTCHNIDGVDEEAGRSDGDSIEMQVPMSYSRRCSI
ncbi:potassium channel subfamily K member 15 [Nematostella vectensis]|uniref:potassium channel subfamily K member 15 n=1 Tax=Nematostella vectensis TaxID=45351 RepID=UPI0020778E71|nr:potassium channel subfamily K member 15 [Nematostella vectensis]